VNDTIEGLKLVLQIVTVVAVTLAAYWSRKDLTLTKRVKRDLRKIPPVVVEKIAKAFHPLGSDSLPDEYRENNKGTPDQ